MTVTDVHPPDELVQAAEAFARMEAIRAEHATPVIVVDVDPGIAAIRAQAGLPPARPRQVLVGPAPEQGPADPWEAELHRREIARRRAATQAGKPYTGARPAS